MILLYYDQAAIEFCRGTLPEVMSIPTHSRNPSFEDLYMSTSLRGSSRFILHAAKRIISISKNGVVDYLKDMTLDLPLTPEQITVDLLRAEPYNPDLHR